jgi:uncharacterized flavoprotein (TIGR03862 family)
MRDDDQVPGSNMTTREIAVIGGGPAGLMAAEQLSASGHIVTVYDAMPTVARKFLLAGKSGLNITHSEDFDRFSSRFAHATPRLRKALESFQPNDVRAWAAGLETETFVGSSGRVFPVAMKASPLLRAWLRRLEAQGVSILTRHRWSGFADGGYLFETADGGMKTVRCDAALLALGGASWPRLGSDGRWIPWLRQKQIPIVEFQPANCGFDVEWSPFFRERFAGAPVKSVIARSPAGTYSGEFVVTGHGIEGSLVYAHAAELRDALGAKGAACLEVDLAPDRSPQRIERDLARQDPKSSLSSRLRKGAGIDGVKANLLRELGGSDLDDPLRLARLIKALPVPVVRPRPIAEAISSAGGVAWEAIDEHYMLKECPGVFVAGEMIDWEAPTGGYLLTASFATGRAAASGIEAWLGR